MQNEVLSTCKTTQNTNFNHSPAVNTILTGPVYLIITNLVTH